MLRYDISIQAVKTEKCRIDRMWAAQDRLLWKTLGEDNVQQWIYWAEMVIIKQAVWSLDGNWLPLSVDICYIVKWRASFESPLLNLGRGFSGKLQTLVIANMGNWLHCCYTMVHCMQFNFQHPIREPLLIMFDLQRDYFFYRFWRWIKKQS